MSCPQQALEHCAQIAGISEVFDAVLNDSGVVWVDYQIEIFHALDDALSHVL